MARPDQCPAEAEQLSADALRPRRQGLRFGAEPTTRYLDTSGAGAWTVVATRNFGPRDRGSSVMYDDGKVLVMGGDDPPTNTAEVIDLDASCPSWRLVTPMAFARRMFNATLLPDGKVLVTGGPTGLGPTTPPRRRTRRRCGIQGRSAGPRWRARKRYGSTIRRRCSCPMAACLPPVATVSRRWSCTRRLICSRERARRSPRLRPS